VKGALVWRLAQCGVGLLVLLALPRPAQIVALIAVPLVALYPFMKRITWWPQAWLGMVFSWGVLVAGACLQAPTDSTWRGGIAPLHVSYEILLFYLGCVFWTIAYDTIYALQDKDDDALVGVRSTARLFGEKWRDGVTVFYLLALLLWSVAAFMAGAKPLFIGVLIFGAMLLIRADLNRIDPVDGASALKAFKANVRLGIGVIAILLLAALWNQFLTTPFAP
jgi:4-hydroxybenzoate polyprenyltransferase